MDREELIALADRILKQEASEAEVHRFNDWYNARQREADPVLADVELKKAAIYSGIVETIAKTKEPVRASLIWRMAGIAAAVATIVFGMWFFKYEIASEATQPRNDVAANDIAPGKYGATITLPGGKVAPLSSAKRGVVIGSGRGLLYDDGSEVAVPVEGQDKSRKNSGLVTVQTAKGQTYELTLPDGTKVWLNANSKLDFYAQFSGKYRRVFIEGEAYFEVFKNPASVFQVFTKPLPGRNQQLVEVLGTHFNINAYPDEPVNKTTLLEGSVTINNTLLKPGHQATLMGGGIIISEVDTEEAIAWKDNKFSFDSEALGSIMRKVARWYDVQVLYGDGVDQQMRFSGSVSRFDNVSSVLRMLSKTSNLKFRIEGKTVSISP